MMRFRTTGLWAIAAFGWAMAACPPADAQDSALFRPRCATQATTSAPIAYTAVCDTGPISSGKVVRVAYQKDSATQPAGEANYLAFTATGKSAAILVAVDRSDRARSRTVALGAGDAVRLIEATRGVAAADRFGLAAILGDRLDVIAPIGAGRDEIAKAASAIRADATPADGSRAVLDAIRLVAQVQAERHILVLASDGKPDDKSYARDDIIRAATDAGVTIVTIGYRERSGGGPEMASLRKLAEETGGYFAEPPLPSSRVDDAVVARFAQFAHSGGTVTFTLDSQEPRGRYILNAEVEGGKVLAGTYVAEIGAPVAPKPQPTAPAPQPAPAAKPATGPQVGTTAPPSPQPQVQPPANPAKPAVAPPPPAPASGGFLNDAVTFAVEQWTARPLVIGGAIAGIVIVLASLIGLIVHRARRVKVFAWIEMSDARRTRVPITSPGVRLGRHSDNDVRFDDKSVHRYHAVLSRDGGTGTYVISDVTRDATRSNGIMVNGELLHGKATLASGDTVELGEVKFKFVYA